MIEMKKLGRRRKVQLKDVEDKRSFLLMEGLVRKKLNPLFSQKIQWSPLTVIEYVENTGPCSSISEEIYQYNEYVAARSQQARVA